VRRGYNMVAVQTPESRVDQAKLIMDRAGLINLERMWVSGASRLEPL